MKVAAKGKDETKSSFDPKIAWGEKNAEQPSCPPFAQSC